MGLKEVKNKLVEIVGENNVSDADFELYAYSRDLSPATPQLASIIVRPKSTEDVKEVVKLANKHKIPIYVRGCGCSHWAAWLPVKGGILLRARYFGLFSQALKPQPSKPRWMGLEIYWRIRLRS